MRLIRKVTGGLTVTFISVMIQGFPVFAEGTNMDVPITPAVSELLSELPTDSIFDPSVFDVQDTAAPATPSPVSITVVMRDYDFTPNILEVKTDTRMELEMRNEGSEPHNLKFESLPIQTPTVAPGRSTLLVMQAPKPGRYRFVCSVSDHEARGMQGVLLVKP